jgi:hypothetical protein
MIPVIDSMIAVASQAPNLRIPDVVSPGRRPAASVTRVTVCLKLTRVNDA